MVAQLAHLGFQVNSFDEAYAFLVDKLGFDFIYSSTLGEFKHIIHPEIDPSSDTRTQMCYVRVAEGQYLELFEGVVTPENLEPAPISKYDDMYFIETGLNVANLESAKKRLGERGVPVDDDNCIYDQDNNRFRLIETGGEEKKHIITGLAYAAFKVNDLEAAVKYYGDLGLTRDDASTDEYAVMNMRDRGCIIMVQAKTPVRRHFDIALAHLAFGADSFEELRQSADHLNSLGFPVYRNVDKKERLDTSEGGFDPDKGYDGTIGARIFDPDDNYIELIYMPEDNMQMVFEKEKPFD